MSLELGRRTPKKRCRWISDQCHLGGSDLCLETDQHEHSVQLQELLCTQSVGQVCSKRPWSITFRCGLRVLPQRRTEELKAFESMVLVLFGALLCLGSRRDVACQRIWCSARMRRTFGAYIVKLCILVCMLTCRSLVSPALVVDLNTGNTKTLSNHESV